MKVWILIVSSESGDDYGPYLFKDKPSSKKVEEFLREECPDEFPEDEDGPGDFGSYLYVEGPEEVVVR